MGCLHPERDRGMLRVFMLARMPHIVSTYHRPVIASGRARRAARLLVGTLAVEDPSTTETLVQVADAQPEEAIVSLDAAADAQAEWAACAPRERGEILRRAYEAIVAQAYELSLIHIS